MPPDSQRSALSVVLNITASFPGNHASIENKRFFTWFWLIWSLSPENMGTCGTNWEVETGFLLGHYRWANIPSPPPPHPTSRLLTPLVGLATWPERPVKCEQLWHYHICAEVACCAVGSVLLPFTTGEHAPASCGSFIVAPKIERHETALHPAWSPAAAGLTYTPTGKDVGLLLETMESWGRCLLYSIS